jgi:hypothetical protein
MESQLYHYSAAARCRVQEGAQFCDATLGLIDDGKAEVNGVPSSDAVLVLPWKRRLLLCREHSLGISLPP